MFSFGIERAELGCRVKALVFPKLSGEDTIIVFLDLPNQLSKLQIFSASSSTPFLILYGWGTGCFIRLLQKEKFGTQSMLW
jgi:hypothetical protein